jgi:hypothetical protein
LLGGYKLFLDKLPKIGAAGDRPLIALILSMATVEENDEFHCPRSVRDAQLNRRGGDSVVLGGKACASREDASLRSQHVTVFTLWLGSHSWRVF